MNARINVYIPSKKNTQYTQMNGRLEIFTGPMFAGKTSQMLQRVESYRIQGNKCVIIKHARDTRDPCGVCLTHGKLDFGLPFVRFSALQGDTADKIFEEYNVIGIDEIQFFVADQSEEEARALVAHLLKWVQTGKKIICAGIDTDYLRRPFYIIWYLQANADKVKKLKAICTRCRRKAAIYSARVKQDRASYDDPVGGVDKYTSLCRDCYDARSNTD